MEIFWTVPLCIFKTMTSQYQWKKKRKKKKLKFLNSFVKSRRQMVREFLAKHTGNILSSVLLSNQPVLPYTHSWRICIKAPKVFACESEKRVKSEADKWEGGVRVKRLDWICLVEGRLHINTVDCDWMRNACLCWNLCGDVISTFPGTTWAGFIGGARQFKGTIRLL